MSVKYQWHNYRLVSVQFQNKRALLCYPEIAGTKGLNLKPKAHISNKDKHVTVSPSFKRLATAVLNYFRIIKFDFSTAVTQGLKPGRAIVV